MEDYASLCKLPIGERAIALHRFGFNGMARGILLLASSTEWYSAKVAEAKHLALAEAEKFLGGKLRHAVLSDRMSKEDYAAFLCHVVLAGDDLEEDTLTYLRGFVRCRQLGDRGPARSALLAAARELRPGAALYVTPDHVGLTGTPSQEDLLMEFYPALRRMGLKGWVRYVAHHGLLHSCGFPTLASNLIVRGNDPLSWAALVNWENQMSTDTRRDETFDE